MHQNLLTARDKSACLLLSPPDQRSVPFRRVVRSSAFQPVRVPNIIFVLFVELVVSVAAERLAPEYHGLFDR